MFWIRIDVHTASAFYLNVDPDADPREIGSLWKFDFKQFSFLFFHDPIF